MSCCISRRLIAGFAARTMVAAKGAHGSGQIDPRRDSPGWLQVFFRAIPSLPLAVFEESGYFVVESIKAVSYRWRSDALTARSDPAIDREVGALFRCRLTCAAAQTMVSADLHRCSLSPRADARGPQLCSKPKRQRCTRSAFDSVAIQLA